MAMDEKMFANYAEQLEKEDFEDEVFCPEEENSKNKILASRCEVFPAAFGSWWTPDKRRF